MMANIVGNLSILDLTQAFHCRSTYKTIFTCFRYDIPHDASIVWWCRVSKKTHDSVGRDMAIVTDIMNRICILKPI